MIAQIWIVFGAFLFVYYETTCAIKPQWHRYKIGAMKIINDSVKDAMRQVEKEGIQGFESCTKNGQLNKSLLTNALMNTAFDRNQLIRFYLEVILEFFYFLYILALFFTPAWMYALVLSLITTGYNITLKKIDMEKISPMFFQIDSLICIAVLGSLISFTLAMGGI